MSEGELIADLQAIALDYDSNRCECDPVLILLGRMRNAHPEATRGQLLLALRRAETEFNLRIILHNGWAEDSSMEESLERLKSHLFDLGEAQLDLGDVE